MNSVAKYEVPFRKVKEAYILVYITYVLLARIVPLVNFITLGVNSVIYSALAIMGLVILLIDFFMTFFVFKSRENIILLLFLVVCFISSVLNMDYGIISNIKTLIWSAIQFFVLFSIVNIKDENEVNRTMIRIMKMSCAVWFVGVVISLMQFFNQTGYVSPFEDFARRQGFVESRLFGVFTDPNFAAVTSIMIVLFCWLLLENCNKKAIRFYYFTNIVVQLIYIVLSGSRTAMYGGVVLSFVIGVLVVRNKELARADNNQFVKSLLGGAIAVALSIGVIFIIKYTMPLIVESGHSFIELIQTQETADNEVEHKESGNESENENENENIIVSLERPDVFQENISNNRYEIWSNYLRVSADHRLFGLSPRNLMSYLKANYPDNFLVEKGYDETHNGWLAIFVCTGIVGTIVMAAFFAEYIYQGCLYLKVKKKKPIETRMMVLFGSVLIVAISAFLQPEIFFINTYGAITFWLFIGYLLFFMKNETARGKSNG